MYSNYLLAICCIVPSTIVIFTTHQQSCTKSNVFTPVSLFTGVGQTPPGGGPPLGADPLEGTWDQTGSDIIPPGTDI